MGKKESKINFYETDSALAKEFADHFNLSTLVASLLVNRGIKTIDEANLYLYGEMKDLHDPFLMEDMEKAVERIQRVLDNQEIVSISGDYDVDGTSGTALLYHVLTGLGIETICSIPDRIDEGYGLSLKNIDNSKEKGVSLIISVDCGISNFEEVKYANSLGIDVIITDHHEPTSVLPEAVAILNPKKASCQYPFKMLSGVGVAYKLACALEQRGFNVTSENYLDLNALGTIADITPLINENRIIAKFGLQQMSQSHNFGIQALLELTGNQEPEVTTTHVGYHLAPRINAAGRIGNAINSLKLLLAKDYQEGMKYAQILDNDNRNRQELEMEIMNDVEEELQKRKGDLCITLSSNRWHAGIIGIVASKIKERYYRPTVLISVDESGNCRGSARSINDFSLIDALTKLGHILIQYGGHKLAAGFSVELNKIEQLRDELNRLAGENLDVENLAPQILVDGELSLQDIDNKLIDDIERLAPFGHGNPRPVFISHDVSISEHRQVGRKSNHLLFRARRTGKTMDGIGFNLGYYHDRLISPAQSIDLIYELSRSTYNNRERIQLKLKELKFAGGGMFDEDTRQEEPPEIHDKAYELRIEGNTHFSEKRYDDALECYKMALKIRQDEPEIHFNIGLIHKKNEDYKKSADALDKAIYYSPDTERGNIVRTRAERIMNKVNQLLQSM